MSDLDNDELIATRKLHGQDDGLYRETSDKNVTQDIEFLKSNEADALYFRGNPKLKSAVESVLERNKELEELLENSIPMQRVEDRIEDLKLSGGSNGKDNTENLARELAIEILQELLGESK